MLMLAFLCWVSNEANIVKKHPKTYINLKNFTQLSSTRTDEASSVFVKRTNFMETDGWKHHTGLLNAKTSGSGAHSAGVGKHGCK